MLGKILLHVVVIPACWFYKVDLIVIDSIDSSGILLINLSCEWTCEELSVVQLFWWVIFS